VNWRDRQWRVYRKPEAGDHGSQPTLAEGKVAPLALPDASWSVTLYWVWRLSPESGSLASNPGHGLLTLELS